MTKESSPIIIRAKIHLYSLDILNLSGNSVTSPPPVHSNSHQLFIGFYFCVSLNLYENSNYLNKQQ